MTTTRSNDGTLSDMMVALQVLDGAFRYLKELGDLEYRAFGETMLFTNNTCALGMLVEAYEDIADEFLGALKAVR